MSQDTRKDPRAKVLTMTVRYKSATLDEFIEHHSYDVSRGGMFIKTPSPFPPGTLLKFEVKIAADQKVIQGVGRVVWKRDSETQPDVRPAGMGVKFIKIDDGSRKVIDALVESRGDAASAYEVGGGDGGNAPAPAAAAAATASKTPAAATEAAKPPNMRKSTMIGLGSMSPANRPAGPTSQEKPAASFFPETKSELEMPAPEDRTVMKQAAELLQDALREAGGSMAEVGSNAKLPPEAVKTLVPPPEEPAPKSDSGPVSAPAAASAEANPSSERKPSSEKPAPVSAKPAVSKPAASKPPVTLPSTRKAGTVSAAPASRRVSVPAAAPVPSSAGGGSRVLVIALVLAATGGLVYAFSSGNKPPEPAPVVSAEPAAPVAPVADEAPAVPVASASALALPAESAAPAVSAAPVASASASVSASAVVPPVAVPAVPKAAPVQQARPVAKPKPVIQPSEPSVPAAPSQPAAEKPAAPPPAAEKPPAAAQAPAPKPAPKPKPAEPAGDNPY